MSIAKSPGGLTGLGAVGGARGTAAGALRIIVEFLTTYDSAAVKQLEADLADLTKQEASDLADLNQTQKALTTNEAKRASVATALNKQLALQGKHQKAIKAELKDIASIGAFTKEGKARLSALDAQLGGNSKLVALFKQQEGLKRQQLLLETQLGKRTTQRAFSEENRLGTERELTRFQQLRAQVPQRIAGLALGAVGGIFGGALIGVGFAAAEKLLDALEQSLLDIFDPARHARDAIKGLSESIDSLAKDGDRQAATIEYFRQLGLVLDEATAAAIAEAVAVEQTNKVTAARKQVADIVKNADKLEKQAKTELVQQLIAEAKARGDLQTITVVTAKGARTFADNAFYAAEAEKQMAQAAGAAADGLQRQAEAARNAEIRNRALAASAQLAAFAEQNLIDALSAASSSISAGLQSQIDAASNAGPSARTQALEKKIAALQSGGGGGGNSAELARIAEEQALIRLRMRLRLLGTNIDLEKYSGKFLLEAINAKLKALQKEAAAQDRLNKLLDLQFRMSQKLRRNEGESITDFLERRAQENRGFLTEQRALEREKVEEALQELQEKTQDEVALRDLAERKKNALAAGGASNRLKSLQKELAASKKADEEATKAKIAALRKQKEAYEKSANEAIRISAAQEQEKIRLAIAGIKTVQDLTKISAQIQGTEAALGFLRSFGQALVATGAISQKELNTIIGRLKGTLSAYQAKEHNVITGHGVNTGPLKYAKGGLINLNNASSPFGSNVRFGEEGSEVGVVLQHSIAKGLKDMSGVGQVGPFYMDRSDNWLRDKYEMKKLVKDAVSEALR